MLQSPGEAGMPEKGVETSRGLFRSPRVLLFLAILIIAIVLFLAAMSVPLDPARQRIFLSAGQNITESVSATNPLDTISFIYVNNVRIGLIEAVPFVGPLFFGYSIYTSGQILEAFAISTNVPPLLLGAVTFIFPHALIEFAGYAVAVTAGVMLIVSGIRRRMRKEIGVFAKELLAAGALLLAAAVIETLEIVSPLFGFALWLPIALLLIVVSLWWRRPGASSGVGA